MSDFDRYSLTIARWLTHVYDANDPAAISTTPRDVTPRSGDDVDARHARFAAADRLFYDHVHRRELDAAGRLHLDESLDWSGWLSTSDGHWEARHPEDVKLPKQGWKVHVSTIPDNADRILRLTSMYCRRHRISFKFLSHADVLEESISKEATRSASGKFITIYPLEDAHLQRILLDLDAELGGLPGPYVLSDLRWNEGPLYVRYGAFFHEFLNIGGVRVGGIRQPDGTLVEDVRAAAFTTPPWVTVPAFLEAQRELLGGTAPPPGFPQVVRALHHSNAGGVYEAEDTDGVNVILKEARPHVGLTPDGRDAVERLTHEATVLGELAHLSCVVRPRRTFDAHGHRFLMMDRVDGRDLSRLVVEQHPLIRADGDTDGYRGWALDISEKLRAAVAAIHADGYSHGDLHPGNVLVTDDDELVLLDFEMSRPLSTPAAAVIGAPGFAPPDRRSGARLDRYALACIELFLFVPLTPILELDPQKAPDLAHWAEHRFALPRGWARRIIDELRGDAPDTLPAMGPRTLDKTIDDVAATILRHATYDRDDRAWPGDPAQFTESPASLAHGAGGVLLALHSAGVPIPEQAREWFDRAVQQMMDAARPAAGLLDGLAGAAWTYRGLGDETAAAEVICRLRDAALRDLGPGLSSGTSGTALMLLDAAYTDPTLRHLVLDLADNLEDQFRRRPPASTTTAVTGRAGLLYGWTGAALFLSRLHAATGVQRHLTLAEEALDADLAVCVWAPDGSFQVDEGWRLVPYLGTGSAGIGIVLAELLPCTSRADEYRRMLSGIERACIPEFILQAGLMQGRAGLIHTLINLDRAGELGHRGVAAIARHQGLLALHAVTRGGGTGFAGDGLIRLSADLSTGAAGVLTALTAVQHHRRGSEPALPALPFLSGPRTPRPLWPADTAQLVKGGESHGFSAFSSVTRTA